MQTKPSNCAINVTEYRRGNQKWTIQRIPKGQSKNGQSRETGNLGYTRRYFI